MSDATTTAASVDVSDDGMTQGAVAAPPLVLAKADEMRACSRRPGAERGGFPDR
jgi:hypothetical protein